MLWALFVDAAHVHAWDVADEPKVFRLVEKRAPKPVVGVGGARGVVAAISTGGREHIWKHPHGIVMCAFFPSEDIDSDKRADIAKIAQHALEAPTVGKPRVLGEVEIESGALAILVPYIEPKVTPALVAKAAKAAKAIGRDGLALVPLARGVYEIITEGLGEYEVDEGLFEARLWVTRKGQFRKTAASGPKPAMTPRRREAFAHRKTTFTSSSISVLYVRDAKAGAKSFVWFSRRGRDLVTESGTWGEKGTRTKKTFPSSADANRALAT